MKKACASVSDPAMPSPRTPAGTPPRFTPTDHSKGKPARATSAPGKRGTSAAKTGASDATELHLRKPHKNLSSHSSGDSDPNAAWRTEIRRGAHALRDARNHLADLHQKALSGDWGAEELRAATARAAQLLREAERLQRSAAELQPSPLPVKNPSPKEECRESACPPGYQPGDAYEPPLVHELRMVPPSALLAPAPAPLARPPPCGPGSLRSKSELELSRRLSESLDMQERLAADNADLDVKRYILYKELMVKEQRLETARAQAARLQNELKLLARDNARLQEALSAQPSLDTTQNLDTAGSGEPGETYVELEKQLSELEAEVRVLREMATTKHAEGPCGGQPCVGGGGVNVCYEPQPGMPPMPATQRDCHVCPPCPAKCNPNAALTPAELEVIALKEKLKKSEDECKSKIAECALLRMEVLQQREEAEKERCVTRDTKNRLRTLEMRFEGLAPQTKMQGPPEKAFETEVNVQNLRQQLRAANMEIEEQRALLTEMEKQLQDYRVKYLHAQQLAEEQTCQIAALDAENVRISEQINLEIQRVKIKFQEKLQELAPLPQLLHGTDRRLKDAQHQQALAEHRAEQLARELNCAREKIIVLTHQLNRPVEKPPGPDRAAEEKLLTATQQRAQQLAEQNNQYKSELERLKTSLIRMEETFNALTARYGEKTKEIEGIVSEKEMIREEAERAIQRANQRTDTVRKCMQNTIAELERQLAASRAMVATSDKEREELRINMENQVSRLQDNCEVAHRRVRGLADQIAALQKITPVDTSPDNRQPCVCKGFLEDTTAQLTQG